MDHTCGSYGAYYWGWLWFGSYVVEQSIFWRYFLPFDVFNLGLRGAPSLLGPFVRVLEFVILTSPLFIIFWPWIEDFDPPRDKSRVLSQDIVFYLEGCWAYSLYREASLLFVSCFYGLENKSIFCLKALGYVIGDISYFVKNYWWI